VNGAISELILRQLVATVRSMPPKAVELAAFQTFPIRAGEVS
jgi:hypothetical protein